MTKSINGFTVAALTATQAAIINNARANAPGANDPRADERKQIKRVGSNRYVPVDVRVVAATNRDLQQMVDDGEFRAEPD